MAATYQQLTLDDALIAAQVDDEEVYHNIVQNIEQYRKKRADALVTADVDLDAILPEFENSDLDFTGMECAD